MAKKYHDDDNKMLAKSAAATDKRYSFLLRQQDDVIRNTRKSTEKVAEMDESATMSGNNIGISAWLL